eukprot:3460014-Rhodomonas_salina.2
MGWNGGSSAEVPGKEEGSRGGKTHSLSWRQRRKGRPEVKRAEAKLRGEGNGRSSEVLDKRARKEERESRTAVTEQLKSAESERVNARQRLASPTAGTT